MFSCIYIVFEYINIGFVIVRCNTRIPCDVCNSCKPYCHTSIYSPLEKQKANISNDLGIKVPCFMKLHMFNKRSLFNYSRLDILDCCILLEKTTEKQYYNKKYSECHYWLSEKTFYNI